MPSGTIRVLRRVEAAQRICNLVELEEQQIEHFGVVRCDSTRIVSAEVRSQRAPDGVSDETWWKWTPNIARASCVSVCAGKGCVHERVRASRDAMLAERLVRALRKPA
jgi:hypothetical protein